MIIPLQEPFFPTPVLALGRDVVDERSSSPRTFLRFVDAEGFQYSNESRGTIFVSIMRGLVIERLADAVFGGVRGHCSCALLRVAFPYAEPLLGPNEMGAVVQLRDEFKGSADITDDLGRVVTAATFDTEANELVSRVFAHRLAWLFHRARPVSPVFDLPGGGRGPVLVPHDLFFINTCGDYWAQFT